MRYGSIDDTLLTRKKLLINSQLALKPLSEDVDKLADELVVEHRNPTYRGYYCGVICEFGIERVMQWRGQSKHGRTPSRLFTHFVTQARAQKNENPNVK